MDKKLNFSVSRRNFIRSSAAAALTISTFPYISCRRTNTDHLLKRSFGSLGHEVTTFGLGGQASIQWTPEDVDPVKIILKAFKMGVNYFDTSNLYGPSQGNFGKAFRELSLVPAQSGYDEGLRKSVFLTSKTHIRWAKGDLNTPGINNWTNGTQGSHTLDDVRRSLSLIFGDGEGNYPKGAYLDMVLLHSITSWEDVDAVYEGIENTDPKAERIGALAALRDVRDGTNYTGLNPKEEKLIKHIGFSGHYSPPVMMELIQRDTYGLLEGMLVAINSNDKQGFNMQNNVIPVAGAKNMGIIAMKVFADGAMYTKEATWSNNPSHVVRTVGSPSLPYEPLIQYSLTTPGIHTAIIGIGQISDEPSNCQLHQNIKAAQIKPDGLSEGDRMEVEKMTSPVKDGKTNYFQMQGLGLTRATNAEVEQKVEGDVRTGIIKWQSAYAGNSPIKKYVIYRDNQVVGTVDHQPQITRDPFVFEDLIADKQSHQYRIVTVDADQLEATTDDLQLEAV